MISRSFNSPILFIHEIWWLCNLSQYHPISLHTLLSMILSNTRKNLQKNDFHALCVITIYSLYWLLKYRKDTLFLNKKMQSNGSIEISNLSRTFTKTFYYLCLSDKWSHLFRSTKSHQKYVILNSILIELYSFISTPRTIICNYLILC